ncbi:MAG: cobalt transporter CbiM [Oceanospirillaceae bacterium]
MAHIPDGVVSPAILAIGATGTILMLSYGLKKLDIDKIPQTAMFAAVFFLSSMITFPVGPSSIHLLFNGLMGLMLGWAAVPAIFVALTLQLMFFGYGGLIVLGVNTFNMALPAIIVALTLRPLLLNQLNAQTPTSYRYISIIGALAGATGIALTTLLLAASLVLSGQEYAPMMKVILATNIPLLIIEAAVTVVVVNFLIRTAPNTFKLSVNN